MKYKIDPNLSTEQIAGIIGITGIAIAGICVAAFQSIKIDELKRHNQKLIVSNGVLGYGITVLDASFRKTVDVLTPEQRETVIPELNDILEFQSIVFQDKMFGPKK